MELTRKSNIELLRILAMLMIIGLHYFAFCDAGTTLIKGSLNYYVYKIIESVCIIGVNIFVLISGYFLIDKDKIYIRKTINLIIEVAFWGFIGFALCVSFNNQSFNIKELIKTMFPVITGGRWFVTSYIIYYLFVPFINVVLQYLDKKSFRLLILIELLLFCIWPSFFPNPPIDDYGYGFIHFIFLFTLIAYFKLFAIELPNKKICFISYIISIFFIIVSSLLEQGMVWAYNYLFVVSASVSIFLLFLQIDFESIMINKLAKCTFGVFLIHTDAFFSVLIYDKFFKASLLISGNIAILLLTFFICLPLFYLFCFILENIRFYIFRFTVDKILDKIKMFNLSIEVSRK